MFFETKTWNLGLGHNSLWLTANTIRQRAEKHKLCISVPLLCREADQRASGQITSWLRADLSSVYTGSQLMNAKCVDAVSAMRRIFCKSSEDPTERAHLQCRHPFTPNGRCGLGLFLADFTVPIISIVMVTAYCPRSSFISTHDALDLRTEPRFQGTCNTCFPVNSARLNVNFWSSAPSEGDISKSPLRGDQKYLRQMPGGHTTTGTPRHCQSFKSTAPHQRSVFPETVVSKCCPIPTNPASHHRNRINWTSLIG